MGAALIGVALGAAMEDGELEVVGEEGIEREWGEDGPAQFLRLVETEAFESVLAPERVGFLEGGSDRALEEEIGVGVGAEVGGGIHVEPRRTETGDGVAELDLEPPPCNHEGMLAGAFVGEGGKDGKVSRGEPDASGIEERLRRHGRRGLEEKRRKRTGEISHHGEEDSIVLRNAP